MFPPYPTFTLKSLELFASAYPSLELLRIDIDTSLPQSPISHPSARSQRKICLDLAHNLLDYYRASEVAFYISGVYPNATFFPSDSPGLHLSNADPARAWNTVKELLPLFSRAREHERVLLANGGLAQAK